MDCIETSLNQKFDSMQANVNKKFDNMQLAISKLFDIHSFQEKGMYLSQPQPTIKGKYEVNEACGSSTKEDKSKKLSP